MAVEPLLGSVIEHPLRCAMLVLDAAGRERLRNAAADALCAGVPPPLLVESLAAARRRLLEHPDESVALQLETPRGALHGRMRAARDGSGALAGFTASLWPADDAATQAAPEQTRAQFALENAEDGLWDWNAEDGRIYRSPRCLGMLGYADGALGDSFEAWQALIHPDDRRRQAEASEAHLRGATPNYQIEYRVRDAQGRWRWILDRGKVVLRAADGRPLRTIGIHTDISGYKTLRLMITGVY